MASLNSIFLSFLISTSVLIEIVKGTGKYELKCVTEVRCAVTSIDNPMVNTDICDTNTGIEVLQMSELQMTGIGEDVFKNCEKLKSLNLSSNSLTSLPHNIFCQGCVLVLEDLLLAQNLIKELPFGIFDNLHRLRRLDLSRNHLYQLPSDTFNHLFQLQYLSLTGNPLMHLDIEDILNHTRNLQEIDITETFLTCDRLERIHTILRQSNISILVSPINASSSNTEKEERNYDVTHVNASTCLNEEQWEYQSLLLVPIEEQVPKLLHDVRFLNRNQERIINRLLELENNFRFLEEGFVKIMTEMRQEMNQLKISIENGEKNKVV